MAESVVVRIAREYREQLARNEDAALKRMANLWVKVEREVEGNFNSLAYDVKAMMEAGQPVPKQYVYSLRRWRSMMERVQRELPGYQMSVEDLIKDYQKENYQLGLDAANAIIRASKPSSDVWTRVYKDAAETMAGFAGNGAPLHTLLVTDYGELASEITDALVSGVAVGKGVNAVVADMLDAMGGDYDRAMRIARTEINRSYRLANAEQYRKSGVVEKVLRLCYKPTACFACLMMDGEECPNGICDDHPNGKCTTIVVTTGGVVPEWKKGSEWLLEQSEEDQRRIMGAGRYDLWKNYGIDPRSMVTMKQNPIWGGSPSIRTLESLRNEITYSTPKYQEAAFSVRYLSKTDDLFTWAEKVTPLEGYEDVFVHGSNTAFIFTDSDGNETKLSAYEFADILKETPGYHGGNIRLFSCDTGGDNALTAQALSDIMNVEIIAPSGEVFLRPDGRFRIENEDGSAGDWRKYKPNGKFRNAQL